jgi:GT2 family glycosyltransferase
MNISVVIPTYQRRNILARTLPTVLGQELPIHQYEVIVVVDGSTDGTIEFLRSIDTPRCALRVIEQLNGGQASARNTGLRAAKGEIVLFLDDDLLSGPTLLREHLHAHEKAGNWVISGNILPASESHDLAGDLTAAFCEHLSSVATRGAQGARWPQVACGANDSVRLSLLLRAGGFDERFTWACEDLELGLRLWRMGARVRYQPKAIVHHIHSKSALDMVTRDAVRFGRNELLLCRTHPEYRPYSPLSDLFQGRYSRRLSRQFVARLPISLEPFLRIPYALAERLHWHRIGKQVGLRLLRARITIERLRSAVREAGSWHALRREFDR